MLNSRKAAWCRKKKKTELRIKRSDFQTQISNDPSQDVSQVALLNINFLL